MTWLTDSEAPWGPGGARLGGEQDDCPLVWRSFPFYSPHFSFLLCCVRCSSLVSEREFQSAREGEMSFTDKQSRWERANPVVTPRRHTTQVRFGNCLARPTANLCQFFPSLSPSAALQTRVVVDTVYKTYGYNWEKIGFKMLSRELHKHYE